MNDSYKVNDLQNGDFNIRAIVDILKAKWYWFAFSIFVCLGVAWFYYQISPEVGEQKAIVLIKDKEKTDAAFLEKQLFQANSNLANEQIMLKSRFLMSKVINRLGLETEYSMKDGFRRKVLYPDIPIRVKFDSLFNKNVSLSVIPLSETYYQIEDFSEDPDWSVKGSFGTPLNTPVGELNIIRTSYFTPSYIGQAIYVKHSTVSSVVSSFITPLTVEKVDDTATLLDITYKDMNQDRSAAIIETLIEAYNDDATQDKNQILFNTSLFIDDRLQIINKELGLVDGDIEKYKKKNGLTNLSSEASLYLNNNNANRQEIIQLTNQMELVRFIREYLNDPTKQSELLPANSGILDTGVEGLINQYNENMLLRKKLIRISSDRNPTVGTLSNELASLKNTVLYSLDNLYRSLQIKLNDAQRQEALTAHRIGTVPTQERYIMSVERQQKIKEELFLYLLNKREENALSMATVEDKIRVIDTPYSTGRSSGMSFMVLMLAAVVVGIFIPSVWFYIEPMLDVSVRNRKDLKDALTIPFLGEIPRKKKTKERIVLDKDVRDGVSEAFRVIRSNLDFVLPLKQDAQVIMFTSANPNSGKTFISSNLAVSLSMTGKRVLLLDMDLRKGSGRKQDGSFYPGVSTYLSGKTDDWKSLVHAPKEYPDFYVIHSGPIPPNPAELLLTSRLDDLIREARREYDYILIDTVPYGIMADPQIISRVADMVIYVIREGLMDRRMLSDVENLYREKKFSGMTVVLNDAGAKNTPYNYGYGYAYKYGKKKRKLI
ncbi:GumC family protein [Parabacteroides bouchesdurhonensis]|uniref:GumC family protein n=1 Tax=Parabacteroides bouchesdurhonensis TaxID=1936995 RepID=UPI000E476179|nr:polysaccharide biosynthesis tyrosine autokinase [Parabacteroides bouchesdurhonensis]RHJ94908.1 capsular biosynthesis protein [Bacteroides sp. AM07-16]